MNCSVILVPDNFCTAEVTQLSIAGIVDENVVLVQKVSISGCDIIILLETYRTKVTMDNVLVVEIQ